MSAQGGCSKVSVSHAQEAERLTYTMPEAASALGVSERYLWKLAEQGIVPLVKLGGRTLVRKAALERVVAEREAHSQSAGRLRVVE